MNQQDNFLSKFPWLKFKHKNIEVDYLGEISMMHPNMDFNFKRLGIIDSNL